jgi:hypothetical protein
MEKRRRFGMISIDWKGEETRRDRQDTFQRCSSKNDVINKRGGERISVKIMVKGVVTRMGLGSKIN